MKIKDLTGAGRKNGCETKWPTWVMQNPTFNCPNKPYTLLKNCLKQYYFEFFMVTLVGWKKREREKGKNQSD